MGKKVSKKHNKTDTIKKRAIYVYLPSQEMVDRWKESAKLQKASISKFVINTRDRRAIRTGKVNDLVKLCKAGGHFSSPFVVNEINSGNLIELIIFLVIVIGGMSVSGYILAAPGICLS